MIKAADRTREIRYAVRDIVLVAEEARRRGRDMLYLNIGDPNPYQFRTPEHILESTARAMQDNQNGYSPSSGIPTAVEAIRRDAESRGVRAIRDIFIGTGASECIEIALTALVNRGENVLLPFPGYPLYTALTAKLECEGRPYYLDEENGWQPNLEHLESQIDDKTRAIVLINPNNPTGGTWSAETLQAIIEMCRKHKLVLFSDEIYDRLIFNGEDHVPTASLCDDICVLTFNGLSKNWIAPGWRLGWALVSGPEGLISDYLEAMLKLTRARLCANHPEQHSIPAALEGDQSHLQSMNKTLDRRARLAEDMLNTDQISLIRPGGAFYAYPSLHIPGSDSDFVRELILETGVVVVPGSGFGQKPGTQHFRIVTLPDDDTLRKAFERIAQFAQDWSAKH